MKAKVVYIEQEKARKINEIFAAEKEFMEEENKKKIAPISKVNTGNFEPRGSAACGRSRIRRG